MVLPRNKPKTKWYRTVKNKCLKKKNRTEIYRANTERAKIKKKNSFQIAQNSGIARNRELHSAMKYHLHCRCKSSMGPWQTSNLLDVQWKAPTDHWGPFERMVHCGVTEGDRQHNKWISRAQESLDSGQMCDKAASNCEEWDSRVEAGGSALVGLLY